MSLLAFDLAFYAKSSSSKAKGKGI